MHISACCPPFSVTPVTQQLHHRCNTAKPLYDCN
nr:MAG TPA: hypothetical protein [Caudoviricetes sp.]